MPEPFGACIKRFQIYREGRNQTGAAMTSVITPLMVRGKRVDQKLWHRSGEEIGLGCTSCPELKFCGGLSIRAAAFNCLALCCGSPTTCRKYACPNQERYSTLVNEAGG